MFRSHRDWSVRPAVMVSPRLNSIRRRVPCERIAARILQRFGRSFAFEHSTLTLSLALSEPLRQPLLARPLGDPPSHSQPVTVPLASATSREIQTCGFTIASYSAAAEMTGERRNSREHQPCQNDCRLIHKLIFAPEPYQNGLLILLWPKSKFWPVWREDKSWRRKRCRLVAAGS